MDGKNFFHHIDEKRKNYNREFFNKIQHKKMYNKNMKLIDKRNETVFLVVAASTSSKMYIFPFFFFLFFLRFSK